MHLISHRILRNISPFKFLLFLTLKYLQIEMDSLNIIHKIDTYLVKPIGSSTDTK